MTLDELKSYAQVVYYVGAGATLIVTAIRYIERKNKYIEDVPKIKEAVILIAAKLKIPISWD